MSTDIMTNPTIDVVIPAHNEEKSISRVIADIDHTVVRHIIVCNNASTDDTRKVALSAGATVVDEPQPGYGAACLRALRHIADLPEKPDIVVFLDGD
ncbi:MAG: glycosyltransferase, partial [Bacteroidota bacterium]